MSITLFLMMGGIGSRFGAALPKQFTEVNGKPIFMHILDAYNTLDFVDNLVIITNPDWVELTNQYLDKFQSEKKIVLTEGGQSRSQSVKNGLIACKDISENEDLLLIHDTTHPYIDINAIKEAIGYMNDYDGVTLCQREYDTVYRIDNDIIVSEIPKKTVVSGASPEIFRYGDLYEMYIDATSEELEQLTSAGAMALSHKMRIKVVPMEYLNIKITLPQDMALFKELCSNYYFRE